MLTATLLFGLVSGHALATHVQCGDVITQDTTLDSDIPDCRRDALVIGAPHITLDLNGHTIHGSRFTMFLQPSIGVDNTAGHDGVTIENGAIEGFASGVGLVNASENLVRRLRGGGVYVERGAENRVAELNVDGPTAGLEIWHSDRNVIADSRLSSLRVERANGTQILSNSVSGSEMDSSGFGGIGISMNTVSHTRVEGNDVFDNDGRGITIFNPDASESNRVAHNSIHDNGGLGLWISGRDTVVSHNVVLRNYEGIGLFGCVRCVAEDNVISDNDLGVRLAALDDSRVAGNTVRDAHFGMLLEGGSSGNVVADNVISGTGVSGGFGMTVREAGGNRIVRNVVSDVEGPGIAIGSAERNEISGNRVWRVGTGISMGSDARFNEIRRNAVANSGTGMYVTSSDDNDVVANSFTRGLVGLSVNFSDRNRFERNRISRNERDGISLIEGNDDDRIVHNKIDRNGAAGISLSPRPGTRFGPSRGIVLTGNTVSRNGRDGIFVEETTATLIDGNVASGNRDDGIDVDDPSTTLARNRAHANGDLGIEAVFGVTDAGGNRAAGNGNRLQCVNVSCR